MNYELNSYNKYTVLWEMYFTLRLLEVLCSTICEVGGVWDEFFHRSVPSLQTS